MQKAAEEIPEPHRSSAWPDCLPMDILKLRNELHRCGACQRPEPSLSGEKNKKGDGGLSF
jgi:hypothetical protein